MAPESKMVAKMSTEMRLFQICFFLLQHIYRYFFSKIQNGVEIQDGCRKLFSTQFIKSSVFILYCV
jgi:hypothetical protein